MNCAVWIWVFLFPILASIGALSQDQDGEVGNSTELVNMSNTTHTIPTISITINDTEQIANDVTVTEEPILSIPKSVPIGNVSKEDFSNSSEANYSIQSNETIPTQNQLPATNATLEHTLAFDQAKNVTNVTLDLGVTSSNDSTEPVVTTTSSWITPTLSSTTPKYSQSTTSNFQAQESTLSSDVPVSTVYSETTVPTIVTTIDTITELVRNVSETVAVLVVENSTISTQLTVEPTLENPTKHVATVSTPPATEHNLSSATSNNNVQVLNSTVTTAILPGTQTFPTSNEVRTTATNEEINTITDSSHVTVSTAPFLNATSFPSTTDHTMVEIVKNFDKLSEVEFFNTATVILDVPSSMEWYERDNERFRKAVACLLNSYSKHIRLSSYKNVNADDVVIVLPSPRIAEKKLIVCFFVRNSTRIVFSETVTSRKLITESLKKFTEKFEAWVGINVSDFYSGIKLSTLLWPSAEASTSNVFERNYLLLLIVSAVASTCVLSLLFGIIYVRCCRTRASRHSDSEGQYESSGKGASIDKVCLTNGDRKSTISNTEDEGWVFPYEQFLSMNREDHTDNTRL